MLPKYPSLIYYVLIILTVIFNIGIYMKRFVLLVLLAGLSGIVNAGNVYRAQLSSSFDGIVTPEGYEVSFVIKEGASLPRGTLVRENGDVLTAEQKSRLQDLLNAGMGEFLGSKTRIDGKYLNTGGKGSTTLRVQTIPLPKTLPSDQVVDIAYQANSLSSDSDTSQLIIRAIKDGEQMADIYNSGAQNWRNYGGWMNMETPYYTGTAVMPAGADAVEFYSLCRRASNGGTYCTAGFGDVYVMFNKDLPSLGEKLTVK